METPALHTEMVSAFLHENLQNSTGPFTFALFGSGGSNLTYLVEDSNGSTWVLRRPPSNKGLATAHDMSREWNILHALNDVGGVPVPRVNVFCSDITVTGSEFYVMEYVPGKVLRTREDAMALSVEEVRRCVRSLVETQVALHNIDVAKLGLDRRERSEPYVLRQLRRWKNQVDSGSVRPVPVLDELHTALSNSYVEVDRGESLVHGDYRFDNVVLSSDCSIAAVLDWELSTIGDPVADFVWSAQYWADIDDEIHWIPDAQTLLESFPDRESIVEMYGELSGKDISDIDWLVVFSWWKQACISEGVYARRMKGVRGGTAIVSVEAIAERVDALARVASGLAERFL